MVGIRGAVLEIPKLKLLSHVAEVGCHDYVFVIKRERVSSFPVFFFPYKSFPYVS